MTQNNIKALMIAKDHLERGVAIMRAHATEETEHAIKRAQCSIDLLRIEITALQLTPFQKQVIEKMKSEPDIMTAEMVRGAGKTAMMTVANMEVIDEVCYPQSVEQFQEGAKRFQAMSEASATRIPKHFYFNCAGKVREA